MSAAPREMTTSSGLNIAILIFEGFDAYDAVGAYEVLSRLPDAAVRFLGVEPGPKRSETAMLALMADFALTDLPDPDVLVIPGGPGVKETTEDDTVLAWLRRAHAGSQWTGSAGAGSIVLGAAGIPGVHDKVIRAAGGVELALMLAARIAAAPLSRALEGAVARLPAPIGGEIVHLVPEGVG